MVRVWFCCFKPLVDEDTAHIRADFLCHHISSLKKQRDKLDIIKVKNWPFYLSNFIVIKKLVVVFLMVVLVVFVLLLTDIGVVMPLAL